jgi:PAS domain S-box-containing protein
MTAADKVNILLVDDQPAKLLSYEAILHGLGENLLRATSGREALEHLLKSEVAVVLVDVCMPDLDGFQLAAMVRDHPRFQKTAMIFVSAIHLTDMDRLRGYEMGAVDYVPVPVVPEVLRAKVKVFAELYRKTRELENLNLELEQRVAARTAELQASTMQLLQSEQRRSLALAAGNMGSWDWDRIRGDYAWDEGQYRIFGVEPNSFAVTPENIRALIHPDDWVNLQAGVDRVLKEGQFQAEFRVRRPNGQVRWCISSAAATKDDSDRVLRVSGVTIDITDRKEAEERQALLAREVDHRAKNALALVQSIVRLTRSSNLTSYVNAVEGRIKALSRAHTVLSQSRWQGADLGGLVDEELAPYRTSDSDRVVTNGPEVLLQPAAAQTLALALHELVTNAAKYGAMSSSSGRVRLTWELQGGNLILHWSESGGPATQEPSSQGFGTKIIIASIERQLGGQATFNWRPEGLQCLFTVPRGNKMEAEEPFDVLRRGVDNVVTDPRILLAGNRVMIVEDEALVALAVGEALTELGYSVVGPFSRVAEATRALMQRDVDAAILDVNLGGELVYPLADILAAREIPFIFVTGYAIESIDRRFDRIPVFQKPIERGFLERIFVKNNIAPIDNVAEYKPPVRKPSGVAVGG